MKNKYSIANVVTVVLGLILASFIIGLGWVNSVPSIKSCDNEHSDDDTCRELKYESFDVEVNNEVKNNSCDKSRVFTEDSLAPPFVFDDRYYSSDCLDLTEAFKKVNVRFLVHKDSIVSDGDKLKLVDFNTLTSKCSDLYASTLYGFNCYSTYRLVSVENGRVSLLELSDEVNGVAKIKPGLKDSAVVIDEVKIVDPIVYLLF